MLLQGVNVKVAQECLRHKDITTTMNIFSHVLLSSAKDAADKVGQLVYLNNVGKDKTFIAHFIAHLSCEVSDEVRSDCGVTHSSVTGCKGEWKKQGLQYRFFGNPTAESRLVLYRLSVLRSIVSTF